MNRRFRWLVGFTVGMVGIIALLYAQEPQRFERGLEIIRGNILMGGTAGNRLCYEGATADAFELCLAAPDVTADVILTLPLSGAADGAFVMSTLSTNSVNVANSIWGISNALAFGGATGADGFEIQLTPADVGADRVVTIPDMAAASALMASLLTTNAPDVANSIWGTSNGLAFGGATGADGFETRIVPTDPSADRTVTLQNASGTAMLQTQAVVTLTNVDLDTTDNSVAASVCETQAAVTAAGIATTDNLIWTMTTSDLGLGFSVTAIIPSAAGQVSIRICNETAGALDPGAVADFRIVSVL